MIENNKELNIAMEAARAAGGVLKENFGKNYRVVRKSVKEMVSEIDVKAQEVIIEILNKECSSYGIITEEKRSWEFKKGKNWIIDPVDGTHNYIAGLPFSGVSIALAEDDDLCLGVIYFPIEDEIYYGVRGKGAFCNGKPISVSLNEHLSKAIVNYDNQFHLSEKAFDYYKILTEKAFTTRIFGAAIKDLCLISCGKIDGRVWNNTKVFDIAAGGIILTEAGGKITDFKGRSDFMHSGQVVASNGRVHKELLDIFNEGRS
jgi:myo-inositol-1(or 4)-monophosphatase